MAAEEEVETAVVVEEGVAAVVGEGSTEKAAVESVREGSMVAAHNIREEDSMAVAHNIPEEDSTAAAHNIQEEGSTAVAHNIQEENSTAAVHNIQEENKPDTAARYTGTVAAGRRPAASGRSGSG